MRYAALVLFLVLTMPAITLAAEQVTADASQWRGEPARTGALQGGPALAESWPCP